MDHAKGKQGNDGRQAPTGRQFNLHNLKLCCKLQTAKDSKCCGRSKTYFADYQEGVAKPSQLKQLADYLPVCALNWSETFTPISRFKTNNRHDHDADTTKENFDSRAPLL